VRHHLVQRIIRAYDEHKTKLEEQPMPLLEAKSSTNGKTNGTGEKVSQEKPAVPVSQENQIHE
jgi:hypothetical protein